MKNRTRLLPSKQITAYGHAVTDDETVAEEFDNYFENIEKTMADTIALSSTYLDFTATYRNNNSLFLTPSCQQEVFDVMEKLKTKKARTSNVETMFIKHIL